MHFAQALLYLLAPAEVYGRTPLCFFRRNTLCPIPGGEFFEMEGDLPIQIAIRRGRFHLLLLSHRSPSFWAFSLRLLRQRTEHKADGLRKSMPSRFFFHQLLAALGRKPIKLRLAPVLR